MGEYDIANLTFRKLPPKLQYENLISTKILCDAVVKHRQKGKGEFNHSFTENTAQKLHEAWRGRNVLKSSVKNNTNDNQESNAEKNNGGEAHIPYRKLSEIDKNKVRNF